MDPTRKTLLEQVRRADPFAWRDFYQTYQRPILYYARKLGLGEDDAQDVLQETMVALMDIMPRFDYDPQRGKFRNFVLTIVHRKCLTAHKRAKRRQEILAPDSAAQRHLNHVDRSRDPVVVRQADEHAWRRGLLLEALDALEENEVVRPDTLAAFRDYVIDGQPASQVASRHGLKLNALYQIRNRVIQKLRDYVMEPVA